MQRGRESSEIDIASGLTNGCSGEESLAMIVMRVDLPVARPDLERLSLCLFPIIKVFRSEAMVRVGRSDIRQIQLSFT